MYSLKYNMNNMTHTHIYIYISMNYPKGPKPDYPKSFYLKVLAAGRVK